MNVLNACKYQENGLNIPFFQTAISEKFAFPRWTFYISMDRGLKIFFLWDPDGVLLEGVQG